MIYFYIKIYFNKAQKLLYNKEILAVKNEPVLLGTQHFLAKLAINQQEDCSLGKKQSYDIVFLQG